MTKTQHQGSLHDQLHELIALATANGLYDAADWIGSALTRRPTSGATIEQIAAWFDDQAVEEQRLLASGQCNSPERTRERWMVYKASAGVVREWLPRTQEARDRTP